jgi:hypothetical protein
VKYIMTTSLLLPPFLLQKTNFFIFPSITSQLLRSPPWAVECPKTCTRTKPLDSVGISAGSLTRWAILLFPPWAPLYATSS